MSSPRHFTGFALKPSTLASLFACLCALSSPARSQDFKFCDAPDQSNAWTPAGSEDAGEPGAWGGKFRYGTLSTTVASHLMWREFRPLIQKLNDPTSSISQLKGEIARFQHRYDSLRKYEVQAILRFAEANRSLTIFDEEESAFANNYENERFMGAMRNAKCAWLEPVDGMLKNGRFTSGNFQANAHRGVHANAYLIPPNSMAALVNAYVAGIRSAEIDVLESCTEADVRSLGTCARIPVVIHDLSTNRLEGDYARGSHFVDQRRAFETEDRLSIGVLNPLATATEQQSTGIRGLMTVKRLLQLADALLPNMTLYLDARNKAPAAILRLGLTDPEIGRILRDKVVIKIYPFKYRGGADTLVDDYVQLVNFYEKQNPPITFLEAKRSIAGLNPNVLLALGNVGNEADEHAALNFDLLDPFYFPDHLKDLPYNAAAFASALNHTGCADQSPSVLSRDDLKIVEGMTWRGFNWALGFSAISNVKILQVNVTPSLGYLVTKNDSRRCKLLAEMRSGKNDLLAAAAATNLEDLFSKIRNGTINFEILKDYKYQYVKNLLADSRFGSADRFPDYTIMTVQNGDFFRKDYYFSMIGLSYQKDGISVKSMRSTSALIDKIQELGAIGLDLNYFTTDLPTDVRFILMGLADIPSDVTFRQNAVIKPRYIPRGLSTYQLPRWSTQLYNSGEFAGTKIHDAYDRMAAVVTEYANARDAVSSLDDIANNLAVIPLMNDYALTKCTASKVPVYLSMKNGTRADDNFGYMDFDVVNACVQSQFEKARSTLSDTRLDIVRQYGFDILIELLPPQW